MRIAVTGRQGQVARALIERGGAVGVKILPLARPDIDLALPETIPGALAAVQADLVINAAAFTAVDLAEAQSERAFAINHLGAKAVAAAAASLKIPVVQLSTDYVFDGTLDRPYVESDPVNPINVYGRSKLAGELAVAAAQPDHVILRTAWVYSPFGKNFVRTMLSLAGKRSEVSVVADQFGAPTNALDIADGVFVVARRLLEQPAASELRGIFHMTGGAGQRGPTSPKRSSPHLRLWAARLPRSIESPPLPIQRRRAGPPIPALTGAGWQLSMAFVCPPGGSHYQTAYGAFFRKESRHEELPCQLPEARQA